MSRATESQLEELHALQATVLLSEIKRLKGSDGGVPPALFAQANKFLKDNGVDRAAIPGDDVDLLADEVPDFDNVLTGDFKCQQ